MPSIIAADQNAVTLSVEKLDQAASQPVVEATQIQAEGGSSTYAEETGMEAEKKDIVQDPESKAVKILEIMASYGVHFERDDEQWEAFKVYLPTVTKQVAANATIQMILPGFPFKDPSSDTALGELPDLGEELGLSHLQGLCDNIAAVYESGAEVVVCSDGLVYNGITRQLHWSDLMGVGEETVWEYGEALRNMAIRKELRSIKFVRLWDVLSHEPGCHLDRENREKAKTYYLEHAHLIRRELVDRYGDARFRRQFCSEDR
ncbi:hypothetical protein NUW58_g8475 [Xylaria curta]|uniref:Uncharacterized protein n=1 Tax=Xylaria curta TaxID=42375 RepID=A0ACC1N707_9PEZI|nr:hypothetical protein NUW58_g8475 [Xylaria curta]